MAPYQYYYIDAHDETQDGKHYDHTPSSTMRLLGLTRPKRLVWSRP
jgi:hypothetical protein